MLNKGLRFDVESVWAPFIFLAKCYDMNELLFIFCVLWKWFKVGCEVGCGSLEEGCREFKWY